MATLDDAAQPEANYRARENILKAVEHLLGICRGMTCDGALSEGEYAYLAAWIANQQLIHDHPIGRLVAERVQRVMADGVITAEELDELRECLQGITGADDAGGGGLSYRPPPQAGDRSIALTFQQKNFVVTGKFIYGPRKRVEAAIELLGGLVSPRVTQSTHYVIVGTLGSRDWTNSAFGTKLEIVTKLQEAGFPIVIVAEPDWSAALSQFG